MNPHHRVMAHILIDEPSALASLLDSLNGLPHSPPSLFIDLEGDNLSRHGTISILQLYVQPQSLVYLIDVHKLGSNAFNTAGSNGQTLKSILESPTIPKVIFDVRNDSDALYSLFQIMLGNVDDVQLMELATRSFAKKHVNGLKKCIERDAILTSSEKRRWMETKDKGHRLFDPRAGGSYAVFNERPLSEIVQSYCIQDVLHLPGLWSLYSCKLSKKTWVSVRDATQARIEESQGSHFNGKGQHMALSPWLGWPTSPGPKKAYSSNTHSVKKLLPIPHQHDKFDTIVTTLPQKETRLRMIGTKTEDRIGESSVSTQSGGSAPYQYDSQSRRISQECSPDFTARVDRATDVPLHLDMTTLSLTSAPNPNDKPGTHGSPGKGYDPPSNDGVVPHTGEARSPKPNVNLFSDANESRHKDSDSDEEGKRHRSTIISDALSGISSGGRHEQDRYDEGYDDQIYNDYEFLGGGFDGSESPTDFTACCADDCGNCGHCSY